MASNWNVCGVCDFRKINKSSIVWCPECDEGLCEECKEHHSAVKSSRKHIVIPVTDYQKLPSKVLEITQICQKHIEQYQTFCKKHDCLCCRRCIIETHNECKDLTAIDDIVQNIKSSSGFLEVEQMLAAMLENIQKIRNDREKNLNCLQEQRRNIETKIQEARKMINDHLDKAQEKLTKELLSIEENESQKIKQLLSRIEENEKELNDLQFNLNSVKQYASELQAFSALKHFEKEISNQDESIHMVVQSEDMKTKTLTFVVNNEASNIGKIPYFGFVGVESKFCKVVITQVKKQQAQTIVPRCIDDIKLNNKRQFVLQTGIVRGCTILTNGNMIFCDGEQKKIYALDRNGMLVFQIPIHTSVCDIAYIKSENTIAVTSGHTGHLIHLIDLNSRRINESIQLSAHVYGITLRKNALVFCESSIGVEEMQLVDISKRTIISLGMPSFTYVAVHADNLIYTNKDENSVTCYDIHGHLKWVVQDTPYIKYPQGISVDGDGNLYVVCKSSNNVVIISNDGQHCRQILSASDGLHEPRVLHYEQTTNTLLIANEHNYAYLYDVS